MDEPLSIKLVDDSVLINDDLEISFRRTVRVLDNYQKSHLPPDLGAFPLRSISGHATKPDLETTAKGGLFSPMYQEYENKLNTEPS